MSISDTLKAATAAEASQVAAAIAALINADQLARSALGQPTVFDAAGVQRLGRIVAEYSIDPAPRPAVSFAPPRPRLDTASVGLAAVAHAVGGEA